MLKPLNDYPPTNRLALPQWYVAYTYSRHEKKVATQIAEKNMPRFLPFRQVMSRWKDRLKSVEQPLFPGMETKLLYDPYPYLAKGKHVEPIFKFNETNLHQ